MTDPGRARRERWRQVKDLFNRAVELPPGERHGFLSRACRNDPSLLLEVESLLVSYLEEEDFLEAPAVSALDLDPRPSGGEPASARASPRPPPNGESGGRVGPYRLLRVVGRGGMGVVYEAERADRHFRKRVALKLVGTGPDSEHVLHRFREERQILAQLEHPGIAGLLDGGVTDDGRPYFVMEFVEGRPIDEYCDGERLDVRARVELVRQVCDAVQYAHRNLVVHRDLKPGNILVTAEGRVKLLDFGIAKLLPRGSTTAVAVTRTVGRMLTPAYASPEQMRGERVTTATDVYSLGVVLYELLAGRHPFPVQGHSLEEIVRVVCDTEPVRPSAAVAEPATPAPAAAGAEARTVRRTLEGDLDNIVLMALRKEPERRYASAAQLSDDLGRYLEGMPVAARKDTAGYRLRKFLRRHRTGVAAVALLFLTLAAGVFATAVQARRADAARALAERRFQETRRLAQALLFDVYDAVADLPGATEARELVARRGSEYLELLAAESGGDRELGREVAEGYVRLGLVLGHPTGANLGDLAAARKSYERALEIAAGLVEDDSSDRAARRTLALAHEKLGDVASWTGRTDEGVDHARRALSLFASLAADRPEDSRAVLSRAISHVKLGDLLGNPNFPNAGDRDGAERQYRRALALLEAPPLASDTSWGIRRYVGLVHERIGSMLRLAERPAEARAAFVRSLAIRARLREENPRNADASRDVAVTEQNLCEVDVALGEADRALAHCGTALDLYRRLREGDPGNVQGAADLAEGREAMFRALWAAGSRPEALGELERAAALRAELVGLEPENVPGRRALARSLSSLASAYRAAAAAMEPAGRERADWRRQAEATGVRLRALLDTLVAGGALSPADARALEELPPPGESPTRPPPAPTAADTIPPAARNAGDGSRPAAGETTDRPLRPRPLIAG